MILTPLLLKIWRQSLQDFFFEYAKFFRSCKNRHFYILNRLFDWTLLLCVIIFFVFFLNPAAFVVYFIYPRQHLTEEEKENLKWTKIINTIIDYTIGIELPKPKFISISKNLPYIPDPREVIYVEKEFTAVLNGYILRNYDVICHIIKNGYCRFTYFPISNKIALDPGYYRYYLPHLKPDTVPDRSKFATCEQILSYVIPGEAEINHGFIHFVKEEEGKYIFSYLELPISSEKDFLGRIQLYSVRLPSRIFFGPFYQINKSKLPELPPESNADDNFRQYGKLIKEIEDRVSKLRLLGISEQVIMNLFHTEQKLSRLIITSDYRIILPDYNDMEIVMGPLPKAVYILFLKHPKGMLFKELSEHKEELLEIYKAVSSRENIANIQESIEDVVDSTKNSINEKCSRIREAFISKFDESLASKYFVTGKRGEPKVIALDRNLVKFE